jgi:hypothetical protein
MLHLFLTSTVRLLGMSLGALFRTPDGLQRVSGKRVLVMLGFIPVFALTQLIHWLGLLLDEIFFRGYKHIDIREPLFVLGVPRSGTTNLHAVLARDPGFTTFSTWECLFAPSVSQRLFWRGVGRVDARIGGPLHRLVGVLERRVFGSLEDVHAMSLDTPEEDYFTLMPVLSCFILVLAFPGVAHLWRMGSFDRDMPEQERRRLLDYYADALRRHLYVHGANRRLLSKNAAFASMANSLAERFPDARFLVCLRDPKETVPSQLSSIRSGLAFFGVTPDSRPIQERFIAQLAFFYENLFKLTEEAAPERSVAVTLRQIKMDLAGTVREAYRRLEIPMHQEFETALAGAAAPARAYRSGHRYELREFSLDAQQIERRFRSAYAHPLLGGSSAVAAVATAPEMDDAPRPADGTTPTRNTAGAKSMGQDRPEVESETGPGSC